MASPGGSFRIFQNLLDGSGIQAKSFVYGVEPPRIKWESDEVFVSERIRFGSLERTRFAPFLAFARIFSWFQSKQKFKKELSFFKPDHVHIQIHGNGFIHAVEWCKTNGIPFSACVHDDIQHLTRGDPWNKFIERQVGKAWREAANRFVISPEIGKEYSRRYGRREWLQVTDGLEEIPDGPRPQVQERCNIYFAGGMNVPYEPNFLAVQQALKTLASGEQKTLPRFILRGGRRIAGEDPLAPPLEPLPFGSREDVARDMEQADLLYLPLSIEAKFSNFAKFSLSTKMVRYLASGLPIFYHGPKESAVNRLLSKYGACAACFSNEPQEILEAIHQALNRRAELVASALRLGREKFQLVEIRQRFWGAIKKQHNSFLQ